MLIGAFFINYYPRYFAITKLILEDTTMLSYEEHRL